MLETQIRGFRAAPFGVTTVAVTALAMACSKPPAPAANRSVATMPATSETYTVRDTIIGANLDAAGIAAPLQQATLGTKLVGAVTDVLVKEGDRVTAGQVLVRIDARELSAKASQVTASIADADAMHRDAVTQANRLRALYADSAATRAQLDAAETGLARAEAGLKAAQASASELGALTSYSVVRAPFAGIVTNRFVDVGAFAAPGAPLVSVQDASTLRIVASTTPDVARTIRRGQSLSAAIEGRAVRATVEGIVPATVGNLYTVNALVSNPGTVLLPGSTATIMLPMGERHALLVPAAAIVREGDLTGVTLQTAQGSDRRWVRVGQQVGEMIEVIAGLSAGDVVLVPRSRATLAPGS